MLEQPWRIALLNGLSLHSGTQTIQRFRTQKTAELLAFLAVNLRRACTREELAETIWPNGNADAARASLRTAIASLRHQLEPPGILANSIVCSDRSTVSLSHAAISTDVEAFDAAFRTEAIAAPACRLD